MSAENNEISGIKKAIRIGMAATALVTGGEVFVGGARASAPSQETAPYFEDPQFGQGIDNGDFSVVKCYTGKPITEPPPIGKVTIYKNPDGTLDGYQQVEPRDFCFTPDHPKGASVAVFWFHDHNPRVSPGFSVPRNLPPAKKQRGLFPDQARR